MGASSSREDTSSSWQPELEVIASQGIISPATENKEEVGTCIQPSLHFLNVLTFPNSTTR